MSIRSIDVNLLEHVKLNPEARSELFDVTVRARLLTAKLVAREGEDGQLILCLVVFVVQLYQLRIVDLCLSSFRSNIDDHTDLPGVLAKIHLVSVNVSG